MQTYIPRKLILLNRNKERSDLSEQVRNKGMEVSTYIADLSKPKEVLNIIASILKSEPVIDIAQTLVLGLHFRERLLCRRMDMSIIMPSIIFSV